ncbi:uncharacterized protein CTRU02_210261 [Colletotrichum truncatum]|uniref:Uncharacterized protein n=1 Tax=Colletotrichum truncatum TaxID=5467 RepID=A0ACC3YUT0_COLTU|nr:uncharacterized protein CTRU02_11471 [Colletotrichum truncatum]KAF6785846.1 hypothetical protein CTRU02_11471 [Colletotrichum truncatum]
MNEKNESESSLPENNQNLQQNREHEHISDDSQTITQDPPPVPDGGYGWIVTISVALINGHSWGISSVYSVFLADFIAHDTFPGTTKLQYALVGSLSVGCTLFIAPAMTVIVRKIGTRPTMLVGALFQSAGLVCASLSKEIWHLFLSQGVLFGLGMGMLFLPSYGIISQWFNRRRALANGIAIAGAGLGGFTYSLSTGAMIRNLGVDWAYRILCLVSAVVNIACTLFIKTRYAATGALPVAFDISLLKRKEFLLIIAFGFLSMLGYFILIFTLANYANIIGLDASQAAWIPALFMLGQAIGRPVIGRLSDRCGHIKIALLMNLLSGVFCLAIWLNAKSFGLLIFFALAVGLVAGAFWVTIGPIIAHVVGLKNLPSGLSILWVALALPSTFSSPIALEIFAQTGKYTGAQIFAGVTFISSSFCLACLWRVLPQK